jgi:hypothetical protein
MATQGARAGCASRADNDRLLRPGPRRELVHARSALAAICRMAIVLLGPSSSARGRPQRYRLARGRCDPAGGVQLGARC